MGILRPKYKTLNENLQEFIPPDEPMCENFKGLLIRDTIQKIIMKILINQTQG